MQYLSLSDICQMALVLIGFTGLLLKFWDKRK